MIESTIHPNAIPITGINPSSSSCNKGTQEYSFYNMYYINFGYNIIILKFLKLIKIFSYS